MALKNEAFADLRQRIMRCRGLGYLAICMWLDGKSVWGEKTVVAMLVSAACRLDRIMLELLLGYLVSVCDQQW